MFEKKQKRVINFLELVPEQNMEFEKDEQGSVKLLIPKFKSNFFSSIIPQGKSKHIRVSLDEIGSAAWLAADGIKNVGEIASELKEKFGERMEQAEERITKFYSQLHQNNIIKLKELKKET